MTAPKTNAPPVPTGVIMIREYEPEGRFHVTGDFEARKTEKGYYVWFCRTCDEPWWGDCDPKLIPRCTPGGAQTDGKECNAN